MVVVINFLNFEQFHNKEMPPNDEVRQNNSAVPRTIEPHHEKNGFLYAQTKAQISFAVTVKLISAFVSVLR